MPYIITTKPSMLHHPSDSPGCTRRAVVTQELEAHLYNEIADIYNDAYEPLAEQVEAVVEARGGTIGPLPDGTVIEVERYTDRRFRIHAAGAGVWESQVGARTMAEIIDAYNARQTAA